MTPSETARVLEITKELHELVQKDNGGDGGREDDATTARGLLESLHSTIFSGATIPNGDVVEKTLAHTQKYFRRRKRHARHDSETTGTWSKLLKGTEIILSLLAERRKQNSASGGENKNKQVDECGQLPSSRAAYLARLKKQKKELFKNPPALPPPKVFIEEKWVGPPKRSKKTGVLTFPIGKDASLADSLKKFQPNRTPEEILRGGAFGGTYFRAITSAVTNQSYTAKEALQGSIPESWVNGLDAKSMLTSQTYRPHVNKYGSKCGGSLSMWESSGWISDADPYGWFQWYCRFYQGRRSSDDKRQILRWTGVAGVKGRWKSQLVNKIIAANAKVDDVRISPVIRQTLWHWGLEINESVLDRHKKPK